MDRCLALRFLYTTPFAINAIKEFEKCINMWVLADKENFKVQPRPYEVVELTAEKIVAIMEQAF